MIDPMATRQPVCGNMCQDTDQRDTAIMTGVQLIPDARQRHRPAALYEQWKQAFGIFFRPAFHIRDAACANHKDGIRHCRTLQTL